MEGKKNSKKCKNTRCTDYDLSRKKNESTKREQLGSQKESWRKK